MVSTHKITSHLHNPVIWEEGSRDRINLWNEFLTDYERNDDLNASLTRWVNEERFPTFVKVTRLNINSLMETNKYLVLAVVEESKIQEIPQHMTEWETILSITYRYQIIFTLDIVNWTLKIVFSDLKIWSNQSLKNTETDFTSIFILFYIALINDAKATRYFISFFRRSFQFGWIGSPDLANSIAIMKVPLPYLLVLNTTTNHHHVPDDEPHRLTPDAIILFLESILNQTAKVIQRLYDNFIHVFENFSLGYS